MVSNEHVISLKISGKLVVIKKEQGNFVLGAKVSEQYSQSYWAQRLGVPLGVLVHVEDPSIRKMDSYVLVSPLDLEGYVIGQWRISRMFNFFIRLGAVEEDYIKGYIARFVLKRMLVGKALEIYKEEE